ncbi:hypothetical protein NDU88_003661 [Pleurodeles waltl]|uniref:Uncharacterized protein n=1 Tax=Pleurodeles waltl TaxID=8319 RepID=A0AAV7QG33_PLEWA|nr:hypothetical protein NDU88_003661 [Pleurodeles waltl]
MACVNIRKCEVDGGDVQSGTVLSLKSGEGDGSKRPMCKVLVEGKKLVLMADSGSPWTIIVQDYFERMFEGIWDMTDLNESDIVAESFEGYMTEEFGSIKEEVWKDCEKNDDVLQEVKGYVRDGWPVKSLLVDAGSCDLPVGTGKQNTGAKTKVSWLTPARVTSQLVPENKTQERKQR